MHTFSGAHARCPQIHDPWQETVPTQPIFDAAAKITANVLVFAGDADSFADPTLICELTKSPNRREVIIPDATHWVLYERNRDVLLTQTEKFLGSTHPSTRPDPARCQQ